MAITSYVISKELKRLGFSSPYTFLYGIRENSKNLKVDADFKIIVPEDFDDLFCPAYCPVDDLAFALPGYTASEILEGLEHHLGDTLEILITSSSVKISYVSAEGKRCKASTKRKDKEALAEDLATLYITIHNNNNLNK